MVRFEDRCQRGLARSSSELAGSSPRVRRYRWRRLRIPMAVGTPAISRLQNPVRRAGRRQQRDFEFVGPAHRRCRRAPRRFAAAVDDQRCDVEQIRRHVPQVVVVCADDLLVIGGRRGIPDRRLATGEFVERDCRRRGGPGLRLVRPERIRWRSPSVGASPTQPTETTWPAWMPAGSEGRRSPAYGAVDRCLVGFGIARGELRY